MFALCSLNSLTASARYQTEAWQLFAVSAANIPVGYVTSIPGPFFSSHPNYAMLELSTAASATN